MSTHGMMGTRQEVMKLAEGRVLGWWRGDPGSVASPRGGGASA